ncbi:MULTISPECIES: hypothetical protein [unclassified Agrobacterium]|uniref:hypothetical protein n=1 Tax=unclassified Agrobacterium TaxID=2632611 RepID=UPI00244D7355|nr:MULTISPECIES: hypothetical protein [unclassified Agrobacterium]MDH0612668.1 hypothetical protein [Agrobacterium sp. GD03872]MDH0699748.1 hypothetical protein [Agrobacterium sp. GD03871]MDH1062626.1 hypothetical protein [Agrobacterium sp. GD03992]MDH2209358.1 hypothetical protein [Agrobacterium sp. GD03643]MDH2221835.1 hypothetical protein [Agrobacterium sp. GD03638]
MGGYTQRVRDSILPLSVAGNLPAAFDEWSFTDNTVDHEQPVETCELCGQQDLRYHFEIANHYTDATLWVGSHCILQFDVAVMEKGRRLSPAEAKRHLTKLTQQMQLESCIRTLEQLATKENNPILSGALDYYRKNKKLTPKYAAVVFWKLQAFNIDHHPSFFQIELRRAQHINDLKQMPTARVHRFWTALTTAQRRKAVELGHTSPQA